MSSGPNIYMAEGGRAAATWHLLLATVHLVLDVAAGAAAGLVHVPSL